MRGFSDEERREIEEQLIEIARERFTRYGFRKTTVQEITAPVGIAEGTFYQFFETKSEVYFRVLLREQNELIDVVEAELRGVTNPEAQLDRLFRTWMAEFEKRPLLLKSHREPQEISRNIDDKGISEAKRSIMDRMSPLIRDIQDWSDGLVRDLSPQRVFELLSVLEMVAAQREAYDQIGWSGYSAFKETLITVVTQGLLADTSAR